MAMESSAPKYYKGPRCGFENCPARQFYISAGFETCRNGHRREDYVVRELDEDDPTTFQGRISRLKKEKYEKGSQKFSGLAAFELYLDCYQLILRKICYSLIHGKGFPAELEAIVRDLWALRLQAVKDRHPELYVSISQSQLYSSQTDPSETEGESTDFKGRTEKRLPSLVDTLGVCYMAMMLIKMPVSLGDLYKWAFREEILYILPLRHVPVEMKKKLPTRYLNALTMRSPLNLDKLHIGVYQLISLYQRKFGLDLPALNYRPLLFKYIQSLALPLDTYVATCRIASFLEYKFAFLHTRFRQQFLVLPEIHLISMLVITVKLYHPFDSLERHSRSMIEPGYVTIDWLEWEEEQRHYAARISGDKPFDPGSEINITEHDAMKISDTQIDHYLDWYEKTWIEPRSEDSSSSFYELQAMFPTGGSDESRPLASESVDATKDRERAAILDKLVNAQKNLKVRSVVSEERAGKQKESIQRIGSAYKRYRCLDDLTPLAKTFYETTAQLAGLSLRTLVAAVYRMELKLLRRRKEQLSTKLAKKGSLNFSDGNHDQGIDTYVDTDLATQESDENLP